MNVMTIPAAVAVRAGEVFEAFSLADVCLTLIMVMPVSYRR